MQSGISLNADEKKALKTIAEALPHMSERQIGYFLGVAETEKKHAKEHRAPEAEVPAEGQPA